MKDCEATTTMVDLAGVELIVDKLERGEEVGSCSFGDPLVLSLPASPRSPVHLYPQVSGTL